MLLLNAEMVNTDAYIANCMCGFVFLLNFLKYNFLSDLNTARVCQANRVALTDDWIMNEPI